jgi:hypothetical protein
MALSCLDTLIDDEPVTNARSSVRAVLRAVQETLAKSPALPSPNPTMPAIPSPFDLSQSNNGCSILFPSLNLANPAQQLIYFSDMPGDGQLGGNGSNGGAMPMPGPTDSFGEGVVDPLSHFHCDVVTTDLYSFFPLNMTPPSDTTTSGGTAGFVEVDKG